MFVGHLALALAGKRAAPTVSLGWLMAAVTALDLVYITHVPDLPLWPGRSPRFGLGLWNSIPGTLLVEGAMWVAGIALYLRHRDATRWIGPLALWSLVLISTAMWASSPWSPPPTDPRSLAWFALIGWIVVPWANWADRYYADVTAGRRGDASGELSVG